MNDFQLIRRALARRVCGPNDSSILFHIFAMQPFVSGKSYETVKRARASSSLCVSHTVHPKYRTRSEAEKQNKRAREERDGQTESEREKEQEAQKSYM